MGLLGGALQNPGDVLFTPAGLAMAQAQDAVSQVSLLGLSNVPQFVDTSIMTVTQALAAYPPGPAIRGKYVRVSDYGGDTTLGAAISGIDRVLRVDYEQASGMYFYTPTTPDYGKPVAVTGNLTLYRLRSPTSVVLTGTVPTLTTRNINIDLTNGRPGEIIEFRNNITSLLGTLNILGLGIGTVVANTIGQYMRFLVDSSSGSLQLVRLA